MWFQQFSSTNSSISNDTHMLSFFERCSRYHLGSLLWSCFCMLSFLFAVPVSLKVLWELHQGHKHKDTNNFFLFNIGIINVTGTALMPGIMLNYMVLHSLTIEHITNYFYYVSLLGRPLFMVCICGDCYFAVVHPIAYRNSRKSSNSRRAIAVSVWIFAFCFSSYISSVNWTFTTPLVTVSMVVSLPAVIFCNISVLQALRKPDPSGISHPQKNRLLKTVFSCSIVTCFTYVPPVVIYPLVNVLPLLTEEYCCNLAYFGMCCSTLGTMSVPFLYLHNVKKIGVCKEWWRKLWREPLSK